MSEVSSKSTVAHAHHGAAHHWATTHHWHHTATHHRTDAGTHATVVPTVTTHGTAANTTAGIDVVPTYGTQRSGSLKRVSVGVASLRISLSSTAETAGEIG